MPSADRAAYYRPAFRSLVAENRADERLIEPFAQRGNLTLAEAAMKLDTATYLPDDLLVKVDIATMANSLEARSPFLDYRLVEFAARLPLSLKIRDGNSKYLVKRAMRDRIPPAILNRRKAGFGVPLGRWFRDDLKCMLQEVVLGEQALARQYFEPAAIRRLVHDHVDGRADFAPRLWALLVLELWHQAFIDRPATARDSASCEAA
ncbi:MAG: asparagine synthetase B family protein, partial [Chloroflexota bacterium]